jgi:hypothetical protein
MGKISRMISRSERRRSWRALRQPRQPLVWENGPQRNLWALALVSRLAEEPHVNSNTGTTEFSLRDPDGSYVTISALNPA